MILDIQRQGSHYDCDDACSVTNDARFPYACLFFVFIQVAKLYLLLEHGWFEFSELHPFVTKTGVSHFKKILTTSFGVSHGTRNQRASMESKLNIF